MKNLQIKTLLFFILIISTKILFSIQPFGKTPTEFIESAVAKKAQTTQVIQNSISDLHKSIGEMQRDLTKARQSISTGLGQTAPVTPVTQAVVALPILPATTAGQRVAGGVAGIVAKIKKHEKSLSVDYTSAINNMKTIITENVQHHREATFQKAVDDFTTKANIIAIKNPSLEKISDGFLIFLQEFPVLFEKFNIPEYDVSQEIGNVQTVITKIKAATDKIGKQRIYDRRIYNTSIGEVRSYLTAIELPITNAADSSNFNKAVFEFVKKAEAQKIINPFAFIALLKTVKDTELEFEKKENNQLNRWYAEAGIQ